MGKGTLALVFGILGFFCGISAILVVIFGALIIKEPEEKGIATAGLILGLISIIIFILLWVFVILYFLLQFHICHKLKNCEYD
ncbi:MAG: hypothetical protein ACP6IY_20365 [Promethearchaeia archaeon]